MANFELAYGITMTFEGGYANNPADTGGETYRGISRKHNPNWRGWPIVDAAKKEGTTAAYLNRTLGKNADVSVMVKEFYRANYWLNINLDSLNSQALANKLFDIAVNMGTGRAANFLQEAINITGGNITIDNAIGRITLTLANNHKNPSLLLNVVRGLQAEKYINIIRKDATQKHFAASWFSRV